MNDIDKKKYYIEQEVMRLFNFVREDNDITDEEFKILCEGICCLPKDIVDKIRSKIAKCALASPHSIRTKRPIAGKTHQIDV